VANWEISFVPPLPVTYTNGAPAGGPAATGAPAAVHPATSPQAITATTPARPIRRPRRSQPRPPAAPDITAAPGQRADGTARPGEQILVLATDMGEIA
jgi:hypothetical protein